MYELYLENKKKEAAQKRKEAETVKDRTFTISLSDADVKRIYDRAIREGTTVNNLLAGFIGDLVDGTYSTGSDERDLANEYVDRCNYHFDDDRMTFVQWLIKYDVDAHDIAVRLDLIEDAREVNDQAEIKYQETQIKRTYKEYREDGGTQMYKTAIKSFTEYRALLHEKGVEV